MIDTSSDANNLQIRLKLLMKKISATGKDMANIGKITEQAFSGYMKGKSLPAASVLTEWANYGININWLLIGRGEMFVGDGQQQKKEHGVVEDKLLELYEANKVLHEENHELRMRIEGYMQGEIDRLKERKGKAKKSDATHVSGAGSAAHSSRGGTE